MKIYDGSKADEIYAALHEYVPGSSDEQKSAIILTEVTAVGTAKIFLIFYFFDGSEPPQSGPLSTFLGIDAILDTTGTKSYSELVSVPPVYNHPTWLTVIQLQENGQGAELLNSRISFRVFIPFHRTRIGPDFNFLLDIHPSLRIRYARDVSRDLG